ncbi:RNA methyltransferase [Longispora sp. NPDC051575]|uniref:TrmH family RNA methyltransferase n=1 Tax=Longispora sp. NPDC051575 TaxID=3154943 RepID=UPI0034198543
MAASPRDRFITVYGRMPVLEALRDSTLEIEKIVIAENASGRSLDEIRDLAKRYRVPVEFSTPSRVKFLAGNGKHDQGVIADIVARRMGRLEEFLEYQGDRPAKLFVLDGVTNPSNVGMILRSATAAGLDGVVLPRAGTPHVGPLVIKASAGVAFSAPILNSDTATQAADLLRAAGYTLYGLSADAPASLFDASFDPRSAFVLGGETDGLSVPTDRQVAIPMWGGVESLNVAAAASVVSFEIARREIGSTGA